MKLIKMDAPATGYECKILEGMGKDLVEKIGTVIFECAGKWLQGHGCIDIIPRMSKNYLFDIYRKWNLL